MNRFVLVTLLLMAPAGVAHGQTMHERFYRTELGLSFDRKAQRPPYATETHLGAGGYFHLAGSLAGMYQSQYGRGGVALQDWSHFEFGAAYVARTPRRSGGTIFGEFSLGLQLLVPINPDLDTWVRAYFGGGVTGVRGASLADRHSGFYKSGFTLGVRYEDFVLELGGPTPSLRFFSVLLAMRTKSRFESLGLRFEVWPRHPDLSIDYGFFSVRLFGGFI